MDSSKTLYFTVTRRGLDSTVIFSPLAFLAFSQLTQFSTMRPCLLKLLVRERNSLELGAVPGTPMVPDPAGMHWEQAKSLQVSHWYITRCSTERHFSLHQASEHSMQVADPGRASKQSSHQRPSSQQEHRIPLSTPGIRAHLHPMQEGNFFSVFFFFFWIPQAFLPQLRGMTGRLTKVNIKKSQDGVCFIHTSGV
jgi:hypothetical protein